MINPMDVSGRAFLVTGASSGIGRETAILLSQLGGRIVLVGRSEERLAQTAARLEGTGHCFRPFDLITVDEIPPWLKSITRETGLLHGLVHSAGIQTTLPIRFVKQAQIDEIMQINLNAALGLARAFRQKGVFHTGSSLVYLTSVSGLGGEPGKAIYSASKGALIAMGRSLAAELSRDGIRVNCVAPGLVQTEMLEHLAESLTPEQYAYIEAKHPLGVGTPRDVAQAIAFLLADTGRWITGTTLLVDGGYMVHW